MSDLLERAEKSKILANDSTRPRAERLLGALPALAGTDLSAIPRELRGPFEADLARINHVVDGYALEEGADYAAISEPDLNRILGFVNSATSRVIEAELDAMVAALEVADSKLPAAAIRKARRHRDLIVPRLIDVMNEASFEARAGRVREGNAHFFALFLLTEFRAQEAFPAILEAISSPDDMPYELFEDAITEILPRALALFTADTPEQLDNLIAEPNVEKYVRWGAARTFLHLVRDGKLSRDEAVRRLQAQLRTSIVHGEEFLAGILVSELTQFSPQEALDDIRQAFERGLVDPAFIRIDDVKASIASGKAQIQDSLDQCADTGIEDTIKELQHWHCFREEPPQPPPPLPKPHFSKRREPLESVLTATTPAPRRPQRPMPLRQWQKVQKVLRLAELTHRCQTQRAVTGLNVREDAQSGGYLEAQTKHGALSKLSFWDCVALALPLQIQMPLVVAKHWQSQWHTNP